MEAFRVRNMMGGEGIDTDCNLRVELESGLYYYFQHWRTSRLF